MIELMTPVALPAKQLYIHPNSRLLSFGSCFAERISDRLKQSGFHCVSNPMGTLYNPASIAMAIEACLNDEVQSDWFYKGVEGMWHSLLHSTAFSAESFELCHDKVTTSLRQAHAALNKADILLITFGTSNVFKRGDKVVANCHRQPSSQFELKRLTIAEIVEHWKRLLTLLWQKYPRLQLVMTVSPYRYAGIGMHENTLSKSVLHLAIEELAEFDSRITYFPAYEIVLDELRDYRFYAPDMLHVSEQASDYVWQRFMQWTFTPESRRHCAEWTKICKDLAHRPLRPDSPEYIAFRQRALQRKKDFIERWELEGSE